MRQCKGANRSGAPVQKCKGGLWISWPVDKLTRGQGRQRADSKGNRRPDDLLGCLEVGRALRARRLDGSENRPYPLPERMRCHRTPTRCIPCQRVN